MSASTIELLRVLGYPAGSVLVLVILAYSGRKLFEKLLESIVSRDLEALKRQNSEALETMKNEYKLVLEDKKAELAREIKQLEKMLSVEVVTYKLAAQKRFKCLLFLWESTESLFEDTDFSDVNSIKESLECIDKALSDLNRYSVLLSLSTITHIRSYFERVAKLLTNSEKNFKENRVTSEKISTFITALSNPLGIISPAFSLVADLSAALVPPINKGLEKLRYNYALEARQTLEEVIRNEFGVWISENSTLIGKEKLGSSLTDSKK